MNEALITHDQRNIRVRRFPAITLIPCHAPSVPGMRDVLRSAGQLFSLMNHAVRRLVNQSVNERRVLLDGPVRR